MTDLYTFNDGLDVEKFWEDDALAHENNCFNDGSKVALGIRMSGECVFDELGIAGHPWDEHSIEEMKIWNKLYNDKAERIVGKRLLQEEFLPEDARFPYVKRIGEVFGSQYVWQHHTEWLEKGIHSYQELEKILDRVETMNYREFMLPDNWESEKKRIFEKYGIRPSANRWIRGPVTLACSVMGNEDFIFLLIDEPELGERFSAAIAHAIIEMETVLDEEAGVTVQSRPGFGFADDCCCLLTPDLYEMFGYPVLKKVFEHFSPNPGDTRHQHSDSDMGHLLPILGRLNFTGVNFGPNVLTPEIRKYMPNARIDGCIAPFTFSRNEHEELVRQVIRDCEDGLKYGGVNVSTAGSINNGSSLESLRLIMATMQKYGRK